MRHTVTNFSRSLEGSVEGAKCSFRSTHCLMIESRSRTDVTRDSAVPDIVRGEFTLSVNSNLSSGRAAQQGCSTFRTYLVLATTPSVAFRMRR